MPDKKPSFLEGLFPVRGIDVSCEYGRQPGGTAPAGVNVRAFEPDADRSRGGSRPGLSKLIDETVNGINEIQHLAIIVTTDPVNLATGVTPPFDLEDFILDPSDGARNPGRLVVIGGSGVSQNRNVSNVEEDDDVANLGAGAITSAGATYTVAALPTGTRTVVNLGPTPVPDAQAVLTVKIGGVYYMPPGV